MGMKGEDEMGAWYDSGLDESHPLIRSRTKIDLPLPDPDVLYCIVKIDNYPLLGYAYLTVVDEKGERVLFYNYSTVPGSGRFVEDTAPLVPLHCTKIKDYLVTFHHHETCPCGWNKQ